MKNYKKEQKTLVKSYNAVREKNVLVVSPHLPAELNTLRAISGYSFEFTSSLTSAVMEGADIFLVDNELDKEEVSKLPYNKQSFYFPVKKLGDGSIEDNLQYLYASLAKDQTVFTCRYDFVNETYLPTQFGNFIMFGFRGRTSSKEVLGLRSTSLPTVPTVRVHSMCYTGDIFHSLKCDCREELENALDLINKAGGLLVYALEEGRGIGVLNKLAVYNSQHQGYDTVDAQYINKHPNDLRDYDYMKDVFGHYNLCAVNLVTNNPEKEIAIEMSGVKLVSTIKMNSTINNYNKNYLLTKMKKNKHNFIDEFRKDSNYERN